MDKITKEDLIGIDKEDVEIFEREVQSLTGIGEETSKLIDKYLSFRLQLIAIAGATFSIYIALHSNTAPQIVPVKYGFATLAISLLFGFVSLTLSLLSEGSALWYKIFDFDKTMRSKSLGTKKLMTLAGFSEENRIYDDDFKKLEGKKNGESVLRWMRGLLTSTSAQASLLFGVGQVLTFLIATILLVVGLFSL